MSVIVESVTDVVTRTYKVAGAPPFEVPFHKNTVIIPDTVVAEFVDGKLKNWSPLLSGYRLLKSGATSATRHDCEAWPHDEWPDWLTQLLEGAS